MMVVVALEEAVPDGDGGGDGGGGGGGDIEVMKPTMPATMF